MAARAASLWDRLEAIRDPSHIKNEPSALVDPVGDFAEPVPTLDYWTRVFSPGDEQALIRRLSWDGIDADLVRTALSGTPDVSASPAAWVRRIDEVLIEAARLGDRPSADPIDEIEPWTTGNEPPFAELSVPACRVAMRRLDETGQTATGVEARRALGQQLIAEIGLITSAALYQRFDAFRQRPAAGSSDDQYKRFVRSMLAGGLAQLFFVYPVLAQDVARVIDLFVAGTREFFDRLDRDRRLIADTFAGGAPLGSITSIQPGLSDPHAGRRRVMAVRFEGSLRLVYKPRSVGVERAFYQLIGWAVDRGLSPSPRILRVLDRNDYGWVEFASHETFENRDQVGRYFRRAGGLLCLAHVLRGADLHMENLVATRAGPVLVDVEMLLQPRRRPAGQPTDEVEPSGPGGEPGESCLATGLLSTIENGPDGEAFDIGGLQGRGTGPASFRQLAFRGLRSDRLEASEEPTFRAGTGNLVMLNGEVQKPESYVEEIISGFGETYQFLLEQRAVFLQPSGPLGAFRGLPVRFLARRSQQYAALAHLLARPRYQRDGAERSMAIDALARPFARSTRRPGYRPLAVAERNAMEALDIPRFTVAADGTSIADSGEIVIDQGVAEAGLPLAESRIGHLSPAGLRHQTWQLRQALAETVDSRFATPFASVAAAGGEAGGRTSEDHQLAAGADWIARELIGRCPGTYGVGWPRELPPDDRPSFRAHDLYDGTVGAMLLFAALARVTGRDEWTEAARRSGAYVRGLVEKSMAEAGARARLGACSGAGSVAYAFTMLGRLTGDRRATEFADSCAGGISPEDIAADTALDLASGSAGTILALLAVHHDTAHARLLELAVTCGERLLATETRLGNGSAWPSGRGTYYVGMAHGTAGIALALARVFEATGDERFQAAGMRAYASVLGQQDGSTGTWPVLHLTDQSDGAFRALLAWCHGAPGILLALASAIDVLGMREALEPAMAAIQAVAGAQDHSTEHVCCGNMARAEALLTIGHSLGLPEVEQRATRIGADLLARSVRRGHFRLSPAGFEYAVFDAGFFRGLSGIGYQFLRLAAPDQVPSILSFE